MPARRRPVSGGPRPSGAVLACRRRVRHGLHRPLDDLEVVASRSRRGSSRRSREGASARRFAGADAPSVSAASAPRRSLASSSTRATKPVVDQAVDQSRRPALRQRQRVGQAAHPQPALRRLGQDQEGDVLLERQAVLGAEVLVQPARDVGLGADERAPRREPGVAGGERRDAASVAGSGWIARGAGRHDRHVLNRTAELVARSTTPVPRSANG